MDQIQPAQQHQDAADLLEHARAFGAFVPLLLNRYKIDPAVAAGPFVTASNDVMALLIYYAITFLLISLRIA